MRQVAGGYDLTSRLAQNLDEFIKIIKVYASVVEFVAISYFFFDINLA